MKKLYQNKIFLFLRLFLSSSSFSQEEYIVELNTQALKNINFLEKTYKTFSIKKSPPLPNDTDLLTWDPKPVLTNDSFFSHGTHVLNTIAAICNNGSGIAWNTVIVPVRIFSHDSAKDLIAVLKGLNLFFAHPEIKLN